MLAACAQPIGVERVDAREVHRNLTRNVLTSGRPSEPSRRILHWHDLEGRFARDPVGALEVLHGKLGEDENPDYLFALAELSFLHGESSHDAAYHRAAAVYAYAFLFPQDPESRPRPLDPRLRLSADLYNRGLTAGLAAPGDETVALEPRTLTLPFGQLAFGVDPRDFEWGGYRLVRFHPLADLEIQGLSNRYRRAGIGAPLAAELRRSAPVSRTPARYRRVPEDVKIPVTAFLRIEEPRRQLLTGRVTGRLELYTSEDVTTVRVPSGEMVLEYESSSSLAASLQGSRLSGSGIPEFFGVSGRFGGGLFMLQPYRRGRIPVVLVHGTASSPAWWAEMLNELTNDPLLRDRYQFWLFRYDTRNPIIQSARQLRAALRHTVGELDPTRDDAALRRMVLIGHSQGGLMVKMAVVDSGTVFWDRLSHEPLEALEVSDASRELLRETFFVEPLPFVERVIFIATPHRGSFRATPGLGDFLAGIIGIPLEMAQVPIELLQNDPESRLARRIEDSARGSVADMTPGDPFLVALEGLAISPEVASHSIIAVLGDGPPEEGNDGVVEYRSASLEGVESEFVVRSGHSTQTHPLTIGEVDRILRRHVGAAPGALRAPSRP